MTTIPEVEVALVVRPGCLSWRVLKCPHCGGRHLHGAGDRRDAVRSYLGYRTCDCVAAVGSCGYRLRWTGAEVDR